MDNNETKKYLKKHISTHMLKNKNPSLISMLGLVNFMLLYLSYWKQIVWNYETLTHFSLIFHKSFCHSFIFMHNMLNEAQIYTLLFRRVIFFFFYIQYICILIFSNDAWSSLKVAVKNCTLLQKIYLKTCCSFELSIHQKNKYKKKISVFTKILSSLFSILEWFMKDHWSGGMAAEVVALILQEYITF